MQQQVMQAGMPCECSTEAKASCLIYSGGGAAAGPMVGLLYLNKSPRPLVVGLCFMETGPQILLTYLPHKSITPLDRTQLSVRSIRSVRRLSKKTAQRYQRYVWDCAQYPRRKWWNEFKGLMFGWGKTILQNPVFNVPCWWQHTYSMGLFLLVVSSGVILHR